MLRITIIVLIALNTSSKVKSRLTTKPVLTVAYYGSRVVLQCGSDILNSSIYWTYKTHDGKILSFRDKIRKPHQDRFDIERASWPVRYDLVIKSVSERDAGWYCCEESHKTGDVSDYVQLFVVRYNDSGCRSDADLASPYMVVGGHVIMECAVQYFDMSGSLSLNFQWIDPSGNYLESSETSSFSKHGLNTTTLNGGWFIAKAVLNVTVTNGCYRCSVQILSSVNQSISFSCDWPSNMQLFTPVKKVNIDRINNSNTNFDGILNADVGEVLNCTADGDLPINFTWSDIDSGGIVSRQSHLTLQEGDHLYRCTASNSVNGVTYIKSADVHVSVKIGKNSKSASLSDDDHSYILERNHLTAVIFVIVFIVVGLLVGFAFVRYIKLSTTKKNNRRVSYVTDNNDLMSKRIAADGFLQSEPEMEPPEMVHFMTHSLPPPSNYEPLRLEKNSTIYRDKAIERNNLTFLNSPDKRYRVSQFTCDRGRLVVINADE